MDDIKYEQKKLYIHLTEPGKGDTRKVFKSISDIKSYANLESDNTKIPVVIVVSIGTNLEDLKDYIIDLPNAHIIPNDIDGLNDTIEAIIYNEGFTRNTDNMLIKHYYGDEKFNDVDLCNILENIPLDDIDIVGLYIDNLKLFNIGNSIPLPTHMHLNRNKLKDIAIGLNIPIISTQQINRSAISWHNCHHIAGMDIKEKDGMKVLVL